VNEHPLLWVALAILLPVVLLFPFLPSSSGGPLLNPTPTLWSTYTVRQGDTLSSLAQRWGLPVEYLVASNEGIDLARLRPGQAIVVPRGGVLHVVKPGQTLADIARTYEVSEGAIVLANGLSGDPPAGSRILVPSPPVVPQAVAAAMGQGRQFAWPARGPLTSPFGPRIHPIYNIPSFHAGIDLALPEGTPVYAAAGGRVVLAGTQAGYGLLVVVDHADGYTTYYGHLSRVGVVPGQYVEAGQLIGRSGNTGLSTGPHLHFEIRKDGSPVDPLLFLP